MVDPLLALSAAVGGAVVLAILFWPRRGCLWHWHHMRRLTGRVLVEDALKHLYEAEYSGRSASVESLAGALGITSSRSAELLARIEARGLLQRRETDFQLTPEGHTHALRIIRVHRLWEQYLAEETGVSEAEWHEEAEKHEHTLSSAEIAELSAQMGHPRFDPHGDPIPTASGNLPPRRGRPLTTLAAGKPGSIVHIEDEPDAVYSQLVAEGLHLGMRVQVTEVSPERIHFWADGDEHVLAPVFATNISVVPLPEEQEVKGPFESLANLSPGEEGEVLRITRSCRGLERRRLMDLGIVPGTVIRAEMVSPSGDPTAYRVRGATIALRRQQATQIHITNKMEAS